MKNFFLKNKKLTSDTLWSLLGLCLPLVIGLFTIPILLKGIGNELFGLLSIVWILIGYFSLFDLGIGRALIQRVSSVLAESGSENISKVVLTGLVFLLLLGVLGGLILGVLSNKMAYSWLNISDMYQQDTFNSLLIISLVIPIVTLSNGLRGVLEALHEFKLISVIRVFHGALTFFGPLLVYLLSEATLTNITLSLVFSRGLVFIIYYVVMTKRVRLNNTRICFEESKLLMRFGSWMTVTNLVSPLIVYADKFVMSAKLGAASIAFYTVPFDILMRVLILPVALTSVLFPKFTNLWHTDISELKSLYHKSLVIVSIVLLPICLFFMLLSYELLEFWVDSSFAESASLIASIISLGILFNGIARVPFSLIQSLGDAKVTAQTHVLEALFYLPIMFYAIDNYGLVGAAVSWVCRVGLDMVILLVIAKRRLYC